jgi:hypothetical protein
MVLCGVVGNMFLCGAVGNMVLCGAVGNMVLCDAVDNMVLDELMGWVLKAIGFIPTSKFRTITIRIFPMAQIKLHEGDVAPHNVTFVKKAKLPLALR